MESLTIETGPEPSSQNEWLAEFPLPCGLPVRFRPVRPDDEPLIAEAIATASRETLLHRFFSPIRNVSSDLLRKMLSIDPKLERCLVGLVEGNSGRRIICGARYVRLAKPAAAEIALTVHDDFQHQGLGTFLLELIFRLAREDGIRWLEADVMNSNTRMSRLLEKVAPRRQGRHGSGDVHHVVIDLAADLTLKS